MRSLIDICDFSVEDVESVITLACDIAQNPQAYATAASGKTLATLFYEPSTRTRLSFESAMYGLGGHVLGFDDGDTSSSSKGETMADTARVVSCYADIIAIRHPLEGANTVAATHATVPVINAGDGGHWHPTQPLTDLLTIYRERGRFDHLRIGICGDLKYGRTVHSLIRAMSRYEGVEFVLISPEELTVPNYVRTNVLYPQNVPFTETTDLEGSIPTLDILYMTRIQRERFQSAATYERLKDSYVLDAAKMAKAPADMCVLHPLPRVGEIAPEIDADPRACYFRQVENGKFVRMALILTLLADAAEGEGEGDASSFVPCLANAQEYPGLRCKESYCISATERDLSPLVIRDAAGTLRCAYCEARLED